MLHSITYQFNLHLDQDTNFVRCESSWVHDAILIYMYCFLVRYVLEFVSVWSFEICHVSTKCTRASSGVMRSVPFSSLENNDHVCSMKS